VARQFSQAPSAAAGGDMGWVSTTDLAPELQPIADRLQPGQVSLPIRTRTGVYIIAVRARRAGAAEGSTTIASLRQITAPLSRQSTLERLQRRIDGCSDLDRDVSGIQGANVIDLGQTVESDLAAPIRNRINGVETGRASPVLVDGEQVNMIVVCSRETGGGGLPSRDEIAERLREQELTLLAERYLRNLRREATIITRQ
jgi:peptidyl-prolyl cis-trans isomerase SurA